MNLTISSIVKKGHSLYVALRPHLLQELGWTRYDRVVMTPVEGDLLLRKANFDEIADAIRGAAARRREEHAKRPNDGPWGNRQTPKVRH
jgi:antitoxin component of MazEF toxin-antitoxin module